MNNLPIALEDIFKLKDYYTEKSIIEGQIKMLEHSPLCENKAKIPDIKRILDECIAQYGEKVANPLYRKVFVFVAFYAFQPNVLAGKKSSKWLRHHIAIALGLSYWRVTGITANLLADYTTNFDFRQLVNRVLPKIWEILPHNINADSVSAGGAVNV